MRSKPWALSPANRRGLLRLSADFQRLRREERFVVRAPACTIRREHERVTRMKSRASRLGHSFATLRTPSERFCGSATGEYFEALPQARSASCESRCDDGYADVEHR